MTRVPNLVSLLAALCTAAWGISLNPAIDYNVSTGAEQNTTIVGLPFYVNQTIQVNALGVFDYDLNGISGSTQITVAIHEWNASLSSSPGTQVVSVTLNNLSTTVPSTGAVWSPIVTKQLDPGWYILVASGFDTSNPTITITNSDFVLDTHGGRVSYGYPVSGLFGTAIGSTTLNTWILTPNVYSVAGATFSVVPEPGTYALMGTVGLALYLLRRRKTAAKS
ncbi:MAG: hypothetical protein KatS3mg005_1299 [Bryobacteraceae bacterium]|nr:MAG: hypothetical protein KatS3mg005_1299 [Bryobacteraceae bacterium]